MSQQELAPARPLGGPLTSPWTVLGVGLALVAVGWQWGLMADDSAPIMRALTLALGLTVAGAGLSLYLARAKRDLEGRLISGALWLVGAGALYVARVGLGTHFDSFHVLLTALTIAAVLAGVITALPPRWRVPAGALLIVLHFAAILTAVTVVPPANGQSPYLANQLWTRVSRPWLQMTLMNNGYHFYAPEPGPSALLWFRVEFADGESVWVRIPDHKTIGTQIERRRLGALATNVGSPNPPSGDFEGLRARRVEAGMKHDPPIPMAEGPVENQYHEPPTQALILIASFVRRVAKTTEHPAGADVAVAGVKVYRVDYYNPPVQHFHAGRPPLDPTLYAAYFMGEYDAVGKMKKSSLELKRATPDGPVSERVQDPFLYWQLPIVRVPDDENTPPDSGPRRTRDDPAAWRSEGRIINYVRIHAGDKKDQETIP
jgi:hypothetical protein